MSFVDLRAKAKKHRKLVGVEGHKAHTRLDRRARGGATKSDFNAAIHDQPARPTIDEPGAMNAVHARKRGGHVAKRDKGGPLPTKTLSAQASPPDEMPVYGPTRPNIGSALEDENPAAEQRRRDLNVRIAPGPEAPDRAALMRDIARIKMQEAANAAGRKRGGHVAHEDEREDRVMVKRMVKPEALTGRKRGGHLTAAQRHKLPAKDFALPGERYPIEDKNHARNALARVSQHGSSEEKARVRAAVHRKYPEIGKK